MAEANIVSEAGDDAAEGRTANLIYILYLLNLIFGVTSFIGVIVAYINKGDAPEWVQSHYRFQIRTFWISLLLAVIGMVTMMVGIGFLVWAFLAVWGLIRVVSGFLLANDGKPISGSKYWGVMAY